MALKGAPRAAGSGRRRGSIDRAERKLLTDRLASDIWGVYRKLGKDWLLQLAQDRPDLFLNQCLSRLMPPPEKSEPDVVNNTLINLNGNPVEVARRVAFALAAGLDAQGKDPVAERDVPYSQIAAAEEDPFHYPTPAPDPEREQWAREASMSPEERLNSETLDEHVNRRAFADNPPRPAWMPAEERPARVPVRLRSKRDLL